MFADMPVLKMTAVTEEPPKAVGHHTRHPISMHMSIHMSVHITRLAMAMPSVVAFDSGTMSCRDICVAIVSKSQSILALKKKHESHHSATIDRAASHRGHNPSSISLKKR